MTADWSNLPSDIIYQLARKFASPEDIITFSIVCRDWEYVSSEIKAEWSPSIPWIMLPEPGEDRDKISECIEDPDDEEVEEDRLIVDNKHPHKENTDCIRSLFDPLASKVYHLKLPDICSRKIFCSPCGSLLTVGLDLEINLFNPLTNSKLSLPPMWTLPDPRRDSGYKMSEFEIVSTLSEYDRVWLRTCFIYKGIVLKLPHEDDTLFVLIVNCETKSLAFSRPGDNVWTSVVTTGVADVAYWKDMVLILLRNGEMLYFDYVESLQHAPTLVPKVYQNSPRQYLKGLSRHYFEFYLVVAGDDLYVIHRERIDLEDDEGCTPYKTQSFKVFKLNMDDEKWQEVEDLGRRAIFVGNGTTTCSEVLVSDSGGLGSSEVCYLDDFQDLYSSSEKKGGGHDMGIYNIKNRKLKPLYKGEDMYSRFCVPVYFRPILN